MLLCTKLGKFSVTTSCLLANLTDLIKNLFSLFGQHIGIGSLLHCVVWHIIVHRTDEIARSMTAIMTDIIWSIACRSRGKSFLRTRISLVVRT